MEVDIVHNQARTTGPLLEILELWQLLKVLRINQAIFTLLQGQALCPVSVGLCCVNNYREQVETKSLYLQMS